jgi:chromosome segregation ATPase
MLSGTHKKRRKAMFGSKKIQELESRLNEANDNAEKLTREKGELEQRLTNVTSGTAETRKNLDDANARISELEEAQSGLESAAADLDDQLKSEQAKNSDMEQNLSIAKAGNADLQDRLDSVNRRISELEESLSSANSNISDLEQSLTAARANISDLEAKLTDPELEEINGQILATQAEFEELRSLYAKKNQDFDESIGVKEEQFAREDALQKYNLEKEIQDDRQANREFVSNTVKEFSESFDYYLNQIRMLMDALGDVAAKTGESLFLNSEQKLLTSIGEAMVEKIQDEDELDPEGVVLVKNAKEENSDAPLPGEGIEDN